MTWCDLCNRLYQHGIRHWCRLLTFHFFVIPRQIHIYVQIKSFLMLNYFRWLSWIYILLIQCIILHIIISNVISFFYSVKGYNPSQWAREDDGVKNTFINMWRFQLCSPKVIVQKNGLGWANLSFLYHE